MEDFVPIRRTQAFLLSDVELHVKNAKNEFVLYKVGKRKLPGSFLAKGDFPQFYIRRDDMPAAVKEAQGALNRKLYKKIRVDGLTMVIDILYEIVEEALSTSADFKLGSLPETIEILFDGYSRRVDLLVKLLEIAHKHHCLKEHSINVMIFTMNYCIYCDIPELEAKRLSLAALLHDIGITRIPDKIFDADHPLSEDEFGAFSTHPLVGYDILSKEDRKLAIGALEHHEKLDGSGYPKGRKHFSFDGQLIGIIDSFDHLTFREKSYRKAKKPFDAMSVIKIDVLNDGKFNKEIFKGLCLSLGKF